MTAPAAAVSPEVVQKVQRLRLDFEAWARTCYTILDKRGQLHPMVINGVQRAIGEAEAQMLKERGEARLYVLKGRQAGITTYEQARNLHQIWAHKGFNALTLTDTSERTDETFEITRRAIQNFPPNLLPTLSDKMTDQVAFPTRNAKFLTGTAGAANTGRGLTLKRLHGSEFAHWKTPSDTLGTVGPGLVPEGSVVTLETTASGFESEGHLFWLAAETGENGYRTLFFPWWLCDPLHYRRALDEPDELGKLEDDEKDLVVRHGVTLEQIKWRRIKMAEYGRARFIQEYAEDSESCWLATEGLFYGAETIKELRSRVKEPLLRVGDVDIYGTMDPGDRCIIGADTAEGDENGRPVGDRSTMTARGFADWKLLASYADKNVTPEHFAGILNTYGRKYLDSQGMPALLVIEKNSHGITVLRALRDRYDYPRERLYHSRSMSRDTARPTRVLGWKTTAETQPLLLDAGRELLAAALGGRADVPSSAAMKDAAGVRRDKNDKVSLNGKDVLVSEMLAWLGRSYPLPIFEETPLSESDVGV